MNRIVEVIEEGRIVKVPEEYARREGLPILRIVSLDSSNAPMPALEKKEKRYEHYAPAQKFTVKKKFKSILDLDKFRKPLKYDENNVAGDLVDNFHWEIVKARKRKNMSRRQLAAEIAESENSLQSIENGVLPSDDFIVINKIEQRLGINLRKSGQNFSISPRALIEPKPTYVDVELDDDNSGNKEKEDNITGSGIEIEEKS